MTSTVDARTEVLTLWATLTPAECNAAYFAVFPDSPLEEAPFSDEVDFLTDVIDSYDCARDLLAAVRSVKAGA